MSHRARRWRRAVATSAALHFSAAVALLRVPDTGDATAPEQQTSAAAHALRSENPTFRVELFGPEPVEDQLPTPETTMRSVASPTSLKRGARSRPSPVQTAAARPVEPSPLRVRHADGSVTDDPEYAQWYRDLVAIISENASATSKTDGWWRIAVQVDASGRVDGVRTLQQPSDCDGTALQRAVLAIGTFPPPPSAWVDDRLEVELRWRTFSSRPTAPHDK
jgi:hypothetical protein